MNILDFKVLKFQRIGIWFALLAEIIILTILTSTFGGEQFFEIFKRFASVDSGVYLGTQAFGSSHGR